MFETDSETFEKHFDLMEETFILHFRQDLDKGTTLIYLQNSTKRRFRNSNFHLESLCKSVVFYLPFLKNQIQTLNKELTVSLISCEIFPPVFAKTL